MKLQDRVALRIRTIRKRRKITQEALAEGIGRTADAVSQLERGKSLPSFETLERLAAALNVPIRDFFDAETAEDGTVQRIKLTAQLLDAARGMSDKDLQMAVHLIEVVGSAKKARK